MLNACSGISTCLKSLKLTSSCKPVYKFTSTRKIGSSIEYLARSHLWSHFFDLVHHRWCHLGPRAPDRTLTLLSRQWGSVEVASADWKAVAAPGHRKTRSHGTRLEKMEKQFSHRVQFDENVSVSNAALGCGAYRALWLQQIMTLNKWFNAE